MMEAKTEGAAARSGWAAIVAASVRHRRAVAAGGVLLALIALAYAATHVAITTDTNRLLSAKLGWRVREATFNALFQPHGDRIVVVIDAVTPERAEQAAAQLAARLAAQPRTIAAVSRPDATPFFRQNGLLFLSEPKVREATAALVAAQPFLGPLAADPSLRGVTTTLSNAAAGVQGGQASLAALDRPFRTLADVFERALAGRPAYLSWRTLISGAPPTAAERRRIILVDPKLDYASLQPGAAASDTIRAAARALRLDPTHGVTARLTGDAPLQDDQLGSLAEHVGWIGLLAVSAIVLMLWFAVRSPRLIGAILATMVMGLVITAALGLAIFHRFNVISVAFIPLFVGLGIDFGIQFTVRFRAEHASGQSREAALAAAGGGMGRSLTLAALAIAAGFLAFAPTAYVGLSQLGVIAGAGMLVALALNLTVLPAIIALLQPAPAAAPLDGKGLERLDAMVLRHRRAVIAAGVGGALVGAALLPFVTFDFDPLHLMNPRSPSVATLRQLMRDPDLTPATLEVVTPSLAGAESLAARLARLPEVAETRTLDELRSRRSAGQAGGHRRRRRLARLDARPAGYRAASRGRRSRGRLAQDRRRPAPRRPGRGAGSIQAQRLAADLDRAAAAPPARRAAITAAIIPPLSILLDQTRDILRAQPVTLASLPSDLRAQWLAPDGRARVSILPKGNPDDIGVLRGFIAAVTAVAPQATGAARDTYEGGRTVAGAFIEAGLLSFAAILLLLFIALRHPRDVGVTLAPIVLTLLLTLGTCVVIGQPLNFANIIAFPLLAGIGVAFHIYFVMAWRAGGAHLLQSSLTRAIFFSALATATGFGSLWASSHPGTASMGKLLMISLVWTLVSALLFQPALMGTPRR